MSFYKQALDFEFESFDFLFLGYQRGWINRNDIVSQAMRTLGTTRETGNLSDIALSDALGEIEFNNLMTTYLKSINMELTELRKEELENKWRLVILNDLDMNPVGDQEKIDSLQEWYAEFDYPQDMLGCSIYSKENIDPLVALKNLVSDLRSRLITAKLQ